MEEMHARGAVVHVGDQSEWEHEKFDGATLDTAIGIAISRAGIHDFGHRAVRFERDSPRLL